MAERPLECSQCKKSISIEYTEIVGKNVQRCQMCADCPVLQKKLHGSGVGQECSVASAAASGLCCGNCGTTLQALRTGHSLGCQECYEVLADIIVEELFKADKVYHGESKKQRSLPLHAGRAPGETLSESPAKRLVALNEELVETLSREDYEQAAYLRDQIKALTEGSDGEEEKE